jgi:outer membrane protein assembly factor BamB
MRSPTRCRHVTTPIALPLALSLLAIACSTSSGDDAPAPGRDGSTTPPSSSPYGQGWSAVHADSANTDYAPVDGPADVTSAWHRSLGGNINLGPTIGPDGRVYVTTAAPGCHLHVLDAATGETIWCSEEVDRFAVASSALLDDEGRAFLADSEAMHAFDADGNVLWETPIVGVPLSAQFTPEGRVIFVTHVGRIDVLRRDTGEPVLPPVELIPGATFDPATNMRGCALGTAECPSANTIAVDLDTGRFFLTEIWTYPIGYVTGGSPSTSPEGLIVPAGGLGQSPLTALIDEGDTAEQAWRLDTMTNRGIATQTAGDKAYATVVAGPGQNDLVVIDTATDAELDREPLPGTTLFSVGITIGPDGTVYVPTFDGELFAYVSTLAED